MRVLPRLDSDDIVHLRPTVDRPNPGTEPLAVTEEMEAVDKFGNLAHVLTILLRGSECSFRCLMCDLWKSTHVSRTPPGAIPAQVRNALEKNAGKRDWIKLYNASNFFAPVNVPHQDLPELAELVAGCERVIVENHPTLLPTSMESFRDCLGGKLEVAMGLETAHPETLRALNKRMTLDDFCYACEWLLQRNIDIRSFVLLRPPGMDETEGIEWCIRSVEFAHSLGVRHISIIPVRSGNGSLEKLEEQGLFAAPNARSLQTALEATIDLPGSIVTADLWDWQRLRAVDACGGQEFFHRMQRANLTQSFEKN